MHGFKFFMMKHTKFTSKSVEGKTAISIKKVLEHLTKEESVSLSYRVQA